MGVHGAAALIQALKADAARYAQLGGWFRSEGFWIGATYRTWGWARTLPLPVALPATVACRVVNKLLWRTVLNVNISPGAEIGSGLYLMHPRNVFISPSVIGENFTVFQDVTVGANGDPPRYPKIGNNVVVYVGARVLGGIQVGDGAKIGANCVVTRSVQAGSSVVTAANRVVPPVVMAGFGQKDFWGRPPGNSTG
jgi:serine acetyltransferase